ncbi:hypothetical protein FUAX_22040 [Fulvitalea axinellae]|uniref:Lipocalin-like domain-containing protein n=2 Tax=Fulvitalea axinellae TaxID=1182444 RepID=A0AAU9CWJ6_9BACT|nr:hypothetical protein FUAX_22040 [Fulvitalea axinellae]
MLMAAVALFSWACQPDDLNDLETPNYELRKEGVVGAWKVNAVKLVDVPLAAIDDPLAEQDVTDVFDASQLEFTFKADNTFTIKKKEGSNAPNFFGVESGTWSFYEEEGGFVTKMKLTEGDKSVDLVFESAPRPGHSLSVSFVRNAGGEDILKYVYDLNL